MDESKIMEECKAKHCEDFGTEFCVEFCSENKLWDLKNKNPEEWERLYKEYYENQLIENRPISESS